MYRCDSAILNALLVRYGLSFSRKSLTPLELMEKLAALVTVPGVHLVRYGRCLDHHSKMR
jgi:hypothetical protein